MRATRPGCRRALHAFEQGDHLLLQTLGAAAQGSMSRLPQSGQAVGTRSVKPQWWQRSVRSPLWKTRQALQCGQPLFQPQARSAAPARSRAG
jgi:hypothetical protein